MIVNDGLVFPDYIDHVIRIFTPYSMGDWLIVLEEFIDSRASGRLTNRVIYGGIIRKGISQFFIVPLIKIQVVSVNKVDNFGANNGVHNRAMFVHRLAPSMSRLCVKMSSDIQ